jgi:hypothetical protein
MGLLISKIPKKLTQNASSNEQEIKIRNQLSHNNKMNTLRSHLEKMGIIQNKQRDTRIAQHRFTRL